MHGVGNVRHVGARVVPGCRRRRLLPVVLLRGKVKQHAVDAGQLGAATDGCRGQRQARMVRCRHCSLAGLRFN